MRTVILTLLLMFNASWASDSFEVDERNWPSEACAETFQLSMYPITVCVPTNDVSRITIVQSEPVASEVVFHSGESLIFLQQPADMVFGKPVAELTLSSHQGDSTESVFNTLVSQQASNTGLAQVLGLTGGALVKFEGTDVVAYWVDSPESEDSLYIYREPEVDSPMLVFGEWDSESMSDLLSRMSF